MANQSLDALGDTLINNSSIDGLLDRCRHALLPEQLSGRILSRGYALSKYICLTVPGLEDDHGQCLLAGILSLLITAYDHGVDRGQFGTVQGEDLVRHIYGLKKSLDHPIAPLVEAYTSHFDRLDFGKNAVSARDAIARYFRLMFDSENQTVQNKTSFGVEVSRKSALPAVAFLIPAIFSTSSHLSSWRLARFAYEIGDTMGLVDDIADLDEDMMSGDPNRINHWLDAGVKKQDLIQYVSQRCLHVQESWSRYRIRNDSPIQYQAAYVLSIGSWVGVL